MPYFTPLKPRKIRFWHGIRVETASIVYVSYATIYVNTCLAIATGQEPWQRRPSVVKATPFLGTSIVSYMSKYSVIHFRSSTFIIGQ